MSDKTFVPIVGQLNLRPREATGSLADADILASIDLSRYYAAETEEQRFDEIQALLDYRQVQRQNGVEASLYAALANFEPMSLLINVTMKSARSVAKLGQEIFPTVENRKANAAVTVLMALGSLARKRIQYSRVVAVPYT